MNNLNTLFKLFFISDTPKQLCAILISSPTCICVYKTPFPVLIILKEKKKPNFEAFVFRKETAAARHLHCAFAKPTLRIKFTGTYFADSGKQQSCLFTI